MKDIQFKKGYYCIIFGLLLINAACHTSRKNMKSAESLQVRLSTLDPGHFHAALVQKTRDIRIDKEVRVFAPDGQELKAHLALIEKYNSRNEHPTDWNENVYVGNDFLEKMITAKASNLVVIAGNNQKKALYICKAINAGLNVLADKPMAINYKDFQSIQTAFATAKKKGILLYDIMTERYEITNILQRELSMFPEVFGTLERGTRDNPAITKESVHHFFKYVSGKPLIRPAWYFDVKQQGNGITDVTTHLVDLIQWECFPETALNYKNDIHLQSAKQWATMLSPNQFNQVTQMKSYPDYLQPYLKDSLLEIFANGEINYTIKGVHAKVSVVWNFQAPEGAGDTHLSIMRGTKASLIIHQGKEQQYRPVLEIVPTNASAMYETSLRRVMETIGQKYPGLALRKTDGGWNLVIPDKYRQDHEANFSEVIKSYISYLEAGALPSWEVPNMIAKYYTTTQALDIASVKTNK